MSAEPALRVVHCAECERLRAALDSALADLEAAQAELRAKRRQLSERKTLEKKDSANHPNFETAERLFEYWKEQCGHPRAKFGPARQKVLLKALDLHTPREIATAIRGAAVAAYVDEKGVRHDGLPLICRDEDKLESFIARYEAWKERQTR